MARQAVKLGELWKGSAPTRVDRAAARLRRPIDRARLARYGRLEELERLAESVAAAAPEPSGPRVLVMVLRSWPNHAAYEAVIAQALRLRGADVALLSCGGGQPICEMGRPRQALPRPCDRCAHFTDRLLAGSRLRTYRLVDGIPWGARADAAPTDPEALPKGTVDPWEASRISVPWFLRTGGSPEAVPGGPEAMADFAVSAAAVEAAATGVLDDFRPDLVFMVNGMFAAEAVIRRLAHDRGLRAPTYEIAPRSQSIVLSEGTPAPAYDMDEAWEAARDRPLTAEQEQELDEMLHGREHGTAAHERYYVAAQDDSKALRASLGIAPDSRVFSLFTNMSWDSATLFHDVAYPSMLEWIAGAGSIVSGLEGADLVVRVHPAEVKWGSRDDVAAALRARLGELPANVHLIGPGEPVSSYALLDTSDMVLGYTTTVGLEAAVRGIPVAVAGDTHYRGRGFTRDVSSHDELSALLADPPGRLSEQEVELARRYAFTFFFRSMVPFPSVRAAEGRAYEVPTEAAQIEPGRDPWLDFVCERILNGGGFVLPDRLATARLGQMPAPA